MFKRRILAVVLCFTVFLSFSSFLAFADDGDVNTAKKDISSFDSSDNGGAVKSLKGYKATNDADFAKCIGSKFSGKEAVDDDENGDYITWNKSDYFTLYRGQKLHVNFTMYDTWENYYTIPFYFIGSMDEDGILYEFAPADPDLIVEVDSYDDYSGYNDVKSKKLAPGEYYLAILAMPCDEDGVWAENWDEFEVPMEVVSFTVKDLPRPSSVKLKVGKKRVTVTFKKSSGANKYQIYRSTKKTSGYKRIATITGTKYVDKKAKKGKRYYYKVRAVRGNSSAGVIYSKYTTPKRSGKVK